MPLRTETKIRLVIIKGFLLIWFFVGIVCVAIGALVMDARLAIGIGSGLAAIVAGIVTWHTVKSRIRMAEEVVRREQPVRTGIDQNDRS